MCGTVEIAALFLCLGQTLSVSFSADKDEKQTGCGNFFPSPWVES